MPKLIAPENVKPQGLATLVAEYNQLPEQGNAAIDLQKLFFLQKLNRFVQNEPSDPNVINWRNQSDNTSFISHLQHYGIHLDASAQVQSIEFAAAVRSTQPHKEAVNEPYYSSLRECEKALQSKITDVGVHDAYIKANIAIMNHYEKNPELQEKIQRSMDFLALSYAKIEAILGATQQNFNEYQTRVLGNTDSNNKNFIFSIAAEATKDIKAVIRVEDRDTLGKERVLQNYAVSEYFSEDYATLMMPFQTEEGTKYQPVIVSELAIKGDLASYATKLSRETNSVKVSEAEKFIRQINDFNLKLMDSGHYHPDIKLSNFLTDGNRLIVSDRKTLIDQIAPTASEVSSTPAYGAPEYKRLFNNSGLNKLLAAKTTLDMPSYMAYQTGMALKEFFFNSQVVSYNATNKNDFHNRFLKWRPFSQDVPNPGNELINMSILVQELTRTNPKDRLSLNNFQVLLDQTRLNPQQFMEELEKLAPKEKLSTHASLNALNKALTAETLTPELVTELNKLTDLHELYNDPHVDQWALLKHQPALETHAKNYLQQVESLLLAKDRNEAGSIRRFFHDIGLFDLPRKNTVKDLGDKLPKMDEITKAWIKNSGTVAEQKLLQQTQEASQALAAATTEITTAEDVEVDLESEASSTHSSSAEASGTNMVSDSSSSPAPDIDDAGFNLASSELSTAQIKVSNIAVEDIFTTIERGNKRDNTVPVDLTKQMEIKSQFKSLRAVGAAEKVLVADNDNTIENESSFKPS